MRIHVRTARARCHRGSHMLGPGVAVAGSWAPLGGEGKQPSNSFHTPRCRCQSEATVSPTRPSTSRVVRQPPSPAMAPDSNREQPEASPAPRGLGAARPQPTTGSRPKRRVSISSENSDTTPPLPKRTRARQPESPTVAVSESEADPDLLSGPHSSDVEIINETNNYLLANTTNRNSTDKRFNESVCPVCFDPMNHAVMAPCGHLFCADCIFLSLANTIQGRADRGACPLCRKSIAYKDLQYIRFKIQAS